MIELQADRLHRGEIRYSLRNAAEFKEDEHPRAEDGKFGSGGSSKEKETTSKKEYTDRERKEISFWEDRINELNVKIEEYDKKGYPALGYKKDLAKSIQELDRLKKEGIIETPKVKGITTTDSEEFDRNIKEIIDDGQYQSYGVRVIAKNPKTGKQDNYKIGDILPPSFYQPDGETTDEELSGTSAIQIDSKGHYKGDLGDYEHLGNQIVLIGSDNSQEGNDIGEIEMKNPKVLAILNKNKTNSKPIKIYRHA